MQEDWFSAVVRNKAHPISREKGDETLYNAYVASEPEELISHE